MKLHARMLAAAAAGLTAAAIWASCSKKASDDESAGNASTAGTVAVDVNPVGASYPDGLSVSALAATDDDSVAASATTAGTVAIEYSSSSLALTGPTSRAALTELPPPAPQCKNSYEEALAEHADKTIQRFVDNRKTFAAQKDAVSRINGKAADCLSADLSDNLETIKDVLRKAGEGLDGFGDCFLPDWGIVQGFYPDTNDVCTVGYVRNQLRKLNAYVNFSKGLSESMLCQALKDGVITKALARGESVDMTASLKKAVMAKGDAFLPITSAKLTRVDSEDLDYLTEVTVTPRTPLASTDQEVAVKIAIDHKPTDESNADYSGIVRVTHPSRGVGTANAVYSMSLDYSRAGDDVGNRMKYELRSGVFASGTDAYKEGVVDFNVLGKVGLDNTKLSNMNYISYDGYPDLDVAKVSYWVNFGANYTEAARGMVFDVKRVDGKLKGCAVAGATSIDLGDGLSIRRSLDEGYALLPVGFLKPFLCDQSQRSGAKMWLQCFYRNDAGSFVVDPDLITDTAAGFDFVDSSVVESKAPNLADVPRPPKFDAARALPPPGAPIGPHMPPAGPPPPPPPAN